MNTAKSAVMTHIQPEPGKASLSAHDLENLIECWRAILIHEPNREQKQHAEARMRELIAQRSPERVREMEEAKGLR